MDPLVETETLLAAEHQRLERVSDRKARVLRELDRKRASVARA